MKSEPVADVALARSDSVALAWATAALWTAVGTLAIVWIPLLFEPRFYFHDDMQHQYLPAMMEIGRALRAGEMPFISELSWWGGNFIGEYQYGLLNPVCLAVNALLPAFTNLNVAAATIVSIYYLILAGGVWLLARSYGVRPALASLAALSMVANPFTSYWLASSWLPGLVSLSFIPWAIAAFRAALRGQAGVLPLCCSVYLVNSAGWPHGLFALAICLAVMTIFERGEFHLRARIRAVLAAGAGYAASIIPLLPLLAWRAVSDRTSAIENTGQFVVPLVALLGAGFPSTLVRMESFSIPQLMAGPYFVIAVWLLPVLMCLAPARWRADPRRDWLPLLILAALLALLCLGPSQLGPLRWSFRWYPYLSLMVVLLGAIALERDWVIAESAALRRLAIATLGCVFLSWQQSPSWLSSHLRSVLVIGLVALALYVVRSSKARTGFVAGALCILGLLPQHFDFPLNLNSSDWRLPADTRAYVWPRGVERSDLLLTLRANAGEGMIELPELHSGNSHLVQGLRSINGYSPLDPRGFRRLLCWDLFSWSCASALRALDAPDPVTGATLVQLLGVTRVLVDRRLADRLRSPPAWMQQTPCVVEPGISIWCFEPPPGGISWLSPGWRVRQLTASTTQLDLAVEAAGSNTAGLLLLPRAWYPGFRATLAGRELVVHAHRDVFLAVDLPPGATGTLAVRWQYPGARWIGPLLLATALALLAAFWTGRRRTG